MNEFLVSPLVEQQLPSFVRDEYPTFIKFIEKYYEWMEQSGNVIDGSNAIRNAQDIDLSNDFYIELIKREFLPFFPESVQLDPRKFLKNVNQFYAAKGTPESIKFLFRALFNEDIDISYPKEQILIASDGKWVRPLALRIDTNDSNIFNIEKCLITGQTSKATAVVEKVIRSVDRQLGISYIEVYISNVEKLFTTGETVSATYNNGTVDVTVSGRLIGALSEINIDANNRGLFYNAYDPLTGYPGDPVSIVGGLNPNSNTPIGAIAYVGETTKGSVTDIVVSNGGFGFRDPAQNLNSSIIDFKGGFEGAAFGTEARAVISLVDDNTVRTMNVSNKTIDEVYSLTLDSFASTGNIQNTAIANSSTWQTFPVYPISFVTITGAGGGYRSKPSVDTYSLYLEEFDDVLVAPSVILTKGSSTISSSTVDFGTYFEVGDLARFFVLNRFEALRYVTAVSNTTVTFSETFQNDISGVSLYKVLRTDIRNLGSLGRINIVEGGDGYAVGEYLTFTGGSGYGANAVITSVHVANNGIKTVEMQQTPQYVIGGEAYTMSSLPTIGVNTVSGANAVLTVAEITGDGEQLDLTTSRIGAISKLRVVSYGYDYVSAPIVSLRNADLVLSNVTSGQIFVSNTTIYQGTSNSTATFSAKVDKHNTATNTLRIFDYRGNLNPALQIKSDDDTISADVTSSTFYGDGRAKATAKFENGLIRLPGLYLNTDGQVSSDKVLQDGRKYHNFSYVISTSKDYNTFKTSLDNIVHPIGTVTFINRIDTNSDIVPYASIDYRLITEQLPVTFNISSGSLNMVSTNNSINVASLVEVGDFVVVESVSKPISGTSNVTSGSNTVIGLNTNFINDIQIGDIIYLSTGNTETVKSITDANKLITQNTIGVTSTGVTINLVFDDTKTVNFVNANTILVDTAFTTNSSFTTTLVQKVE